MEATFTLNACPASLDAEAYAHEARWALLSLGERIYVKVGVSVLRPSVLALSGTSQMPPDLKAAANVPGFFRDSQTALIAFIQARLGDADSVAIFPHALGKRGELGIEQKALAFNAHYFGDEVYFVLGREKAREVAYVRDFVQQTATHFQSVIIAKGLPSDGHDISESLMSAWAKTAGAIVYSAFDADGFIVFERGSPVDSE